MSWLDSNFTYKSGDTPNYTRKIEWISDRICWCWKWRKITKEQMEELCDRVIKVLERD